MDSRYKSSTGGINGVMYHPDQIKNVFLEFELYSFEYFYITKTQISLPYKSISFVVLSNNSICKRNVDINF